LGCCGDSSQSPLGAPQRPHRMARDASHTLIAFASSLRLALAPLPRAATALPSPATEQPQGIAGETGGAGGERVRSQVRRIVIRPKSTQRLV